MVGWNITLSQQYVTVRGMKMSITIATVEVVFAYDNVSDFEVHQRLQEMIEQDAMPIDYRTVEGEGDEDE